MSSMCIFRIAKIKSINQLGAVANHNLRTRPTPNADPNKKNIVVKGGHNFEQIKSSWNQKVAGMTVRKNAVIATEVLISASPEYFRPDDPKKSGYWLKERLHKWRAATEKFIAKQFPHAISVVLHLDESTPHYQIIDVPLMPNKKGKLALSHYAKFGASRFDLSKWQDLAAASVEHLGIKRGLKNSTAKHTTIQKYYSALQTPTAKLPPVTTPKPEPMPPAGLMEKLPLSQAAKNRSQKEKDHEEQQKKRLKEIRERNKAKLKNYDIIEKKANQYDLLAKKLDSAKTGLQRLQDEIKQKDLEIEALKSIAKRLRPIDPETVLERVYNTQKLSATVFKVGDRTIRIQDAPRATLAGSKVWILGDKKGRGAIDLVMKLENCDYEKAVSILLDHFETDLITADSNALTETIYAQAIQKIAKEKAKEAEQNQPKHTESPVDEPEAVQQPTRVRPRG